jgi:hypothetical protein
VAKREKGDLPTTRTKVSIITDAQCFGLLLHGRPYRTFDLVFAPGFDNDHLKPEALHRGLRQLDVVLHEAGIVWIDKEGDPRDAGEDLMQKL